MAERASCQFRYIERGRTFCSIANMDLQSTTAEVHPLVCRDCPVPQILKAHPCANLDVGVRIVSYIGGSHVSEVFLSCKAFVERLDNANSCSQGSCARFEALK